MARVLLFGAGATGARIARQLRSSGAVDTLEIRDPSLERRERLVDDLGTFLGGELGLGLVDHALVGELVVEPELAEAAAEDAALVAVNGRNVARLRDLLADGLELLGGLDAAVDGDAVDAAEHLGAVLLLADGVGAAAVDALEETGGVHIHKLLLGEERAEVAIIEDGRLPAARGEGDAEVTVGEGVGHFC